MIEHTMMVKGRKAMIFYTTTNQPVTYRHDGSRHYAYQGFNLIAKFVEPQGWSE
jgi:hypothetical protein